MKGLKAEDFLPCGTPDFTPLFVDTAYKTRLLIVRHGESLANAVRVFLGHTNLGLSERGHEQARATAEYLKGEPISAIYSSDLCRAYDTAMPHAMMRSMSVVPDERLRELYIGEWENMKIDDIIARYGEEYTVGWKLKFGEYTPPGGESIQACGERFFSRVLEIARAHEGECILITAHAAVIRSFFAKIAGIAPERVAEEIDFPYNASVTTVYYDGSALIPGEYSHARHLVG